ncbi:MAG: DNA modification methylase [Phycisphaeraceae bacterium]|nr:DNA modification methylase [Phycisphaeraceae bacterium]
MNIQRLPVNQLKTAAYNPRVDLQPGDPRYEQLVRSIDTFGLVEPLVWNRRSGNLVGGHQRLKVLIARGERDVDVVVVDLPPAQEQALNLALNKIQGDWDQQKLAQLLHQLLDTPQFDIELTGFGLDEATDLVHEVLGNSAGQLEESFDVEATLAQVGEPVTQPGQLILLGRDPAKQHRLLCGDATDSMQVRQLMDGERAALFVTDPPYLVGYDGTNRPGARCAKGRCLSDSTRASSASTTTHVGEAQKGLPDAGGFNWDDAATNPDLYAKFVHAAVAEAVAPNAAWYCWHASRRQAMLEQVWRDAGMLIHCQIVWVKNRAVPGRTWYLWQHEPCLMGWLKGHMPRRADSRHLPTVWQVDTLPNGLERPDHPTPKPLALFEIPLRQHTRPGEICYEPFAGSGTQFIAAQRLGRRCFGLEISPRYCDLIVRRFIAMAGPDAVAPDIAHRYRISDLSAHQITPITPGVTSVDSPNRE